jgi:hypothetical protein
LHRPPKAISSGSFSSDTPPCGPHSNAPAAAIRLYERHGFVETGRKDWDLFYRRAVMP